MRMNLQEGVFLKRYKRFFADIDWQGATIVAHVANTGSMRGCNEPGSACLFSVSDDPNRKLKYTLEFIRAPGGAWVGVNTSVPNKIVREALEAKLLPHWAPATFIKPEFKISAETRFDFALDMPGGKKHFIEVKNVSLAENGRARFPDAVTERGQKHLRELIALRGQGHDTELVFTVQRDDAETFGPADDIDPEYGRLFREAMKAGVRMTPLRVTFANGEVKLSDRALRLDV